MSTFWSNLVTLALGAIFFLGTSSWDKEGFYITWIGILWGILFSIGMVLQKTILKEVETNSLFPITSSVSNIVTIFLGVMLLHESVSMAQCLGMMLTITAVFLLSAEKGTVPLRGRLLFLMTCSIVISVLSKYVQKFGMDRNPVNTFMISEYLGASATGLVLFGVTKEARFSELFKFSYAKGAFFIGGFGFLAALAMLLALKHGTLSGVYGITPLYVVIVAFLGKIFFKEELTFKKILLILLSVTGIILIKLGCSL